MSAPDRRAMLDRADKSLSVRRQCALLSVGRSGVYRAGKPANDGALMRRIDELFTAWPFLGSRQARGACVAAVEHDGRFVLSGGARGGSGEVRQARDFQHRPRLAVHFGALHRRARRSGVAISMDGRGRWMDNVFIERLWRSLKYEDVYLKGYADGREAARGIAAWIAFYNDRRPHQALTDRAPMAV